MKIITVIIFIIIITIIIPPVFAQEDIGSARLHPAHPLYFLKGVRENLELKLAQTDRVKKLRQLEFAQRRLREVNSLIPINQELIPAVLERYIVHLNNIKDKHIPGDALIPIIQNDLTMDLKALELIFAKAENLRAKMAIRSAMNRVIQRADVVKEVKLPVCYFFAKEASSSALNQTEQLVLKNRAEKCFNSYNKL